MTTFKAQKPNDGSEDSGLDDTPTEHQSCVTRKKCKHLNSKGDPIGASEEHQGLRNSSLPTKTTLNNKAKMRSMQAELDGKSSTSRESASLEQNSSKRDHQVDEDSQSSLTYNAQSQGTDQSTTQIAKDSTSNPTANLQVKIQKELKLLPKGTRIEPALIGPRSSPANPSYLVHKVLQKASRKVGSLNRHYAAAAKSQEAGTDLLDQLRAQSSDNPSLQVVLREIGERFATAMDTCANIVDDLEAVQNEVNTSLQALAGDINGEGHHTDTKEPGLDDHAGQKNGVQKGPNPNRKG